MDRAASGAAAVDGGVVWGRRIVGAAKPRWMDGHLLKYVYLGLYNLSLVSF